jgi:hypothetical protein
MSLAIFHRNMVFGIRDQNFALCKQKGWSIREKPSKIELFNEHHQLMACFYGHIALSQYLKETRRE